MPTMQLGDRCHENRGHAHLSACQADWVCTQVLLLSLPCLCPIQTGKTGQNCYNKTIQAFVTEHPMKHHGV